jgi:hypothetical protein
MSGSINALKRSGDQLENPRAVKKQRVEPIQSAIQVFLNRKDIKGAKARLNQFRLEAPGEIDLIDRLRMFIHETESKVIWEEYEEPQREQLIKSVHKLIEQYREVEERNKGYFTIPSIEPSIEALENLILKIQEDEDLGLLEDVFAEYEGNLSDIVQLGREELVQEGPEGAQAAEIEKIEEIADELQSWCDELSYLFWYDEGKQEIHAYFQTGTEDQQAHFLSRCSVFELGQLLSAFIPAQLLKTVSLERIQRALTSGTIDEKDLPFIAEQMYSVIEEEQFFRTIPIPSTSTLELCRKHLNTRLPADVKVRAGNYEFFAHRAILSLDSYFKDRVTFEPGLEHEVRLHLKRLYGTLSLEDYANPYVTVLLEQPLNLERLAFSRFLLAREIKG